MYVGSSSGEGEGGVKGKHSKVKGVRGSGIRVKGKQGSGALQARQGKATNQPTQQQLRWARLGR